MEITNNTIYSDESIRKYISFSMNKGKHHSVHKKICTIIWAILVVVLLASIILLAYVKPAKLIEVIPEFIIVTMAFLLVNVILPRISYKNGQKLIGSTMQFVFNENGFLINSSCEYAKANGEYKYDFLYNVYEMDNYYYLYINKVSAYIVDKNGFENTMPEDFSKFLESKLPPNKYIKCR